MDNGLVQRETGCSAGHGPRARLSVLRRAFPTRDAGAELGGRALGSRKLYTTAGSRRLGRDDSGTPKPRQRA